jgi:hypothetical protein
MWFLQYKIYPQIHTEIQLDDRSLYILNISDKLYIPFRSILYSPNRD